jgi:hypothetical protein
VTRRRIPKLTLTQPASIVVSDGEDSYQISPSGFQQGDPLSSLLFSLSIHQTLEELQRALKGHGDFLLLLYYPSPHSPFLPPFPPAMPSSLTHHALFIRTSRHNRTQSKRLYSPPIPPLRFLFNPSALIFHFVVSSCLQRRWSIHSIHSLRRSRCRNPLTHCTRFHSTGRALQTRREGIATEIAEHKKNKSSRKDSLSFPFFL